MFPTFRCGSYAKPYLLRLAMLGGLKHRTPQPSLDHGDEPRTGQ